MARFTVLFVILLCIASVLAQGDAQGAACTKSCRDGLICGLNKTCQYCHDNSQCAGLGSQTICKQTQFLKVKEQLCLHKNLLPLSWLDIVAFIIFFTACAFAAGGGIGGGGIYVPVLILVGEFVTKEAVPLSNVIVTGASIANLFVNFRKRNPNDKNKPLIDYSVALLIEPQTLGGTIVGVYLHNMFPAYLILALLIIIMTATTVRTAMKGTQLYKKEQRMGKERTQVAKPLLDIQDKPAPKKKLYQIVSWKRIAALIIILAISTVLALLKGGGGDKSLAGVGVCTPMYWLIAAAVFPVIFFVWGLEGYFAIKESNRRRGLPNLPGEVRWTFGKVAGVGFVSFVAGILASLLGVGGGIIKGPVLLELGLTPDVVSATSAYMIVFTSISATVQYILIGSIVYDYGGVLFVIGLLACFIGRITLNWIVAKYKRQSFIIFVISAVIGVSCVLLVVSMVIQFTTQGGDDSFHWGCPADD
eukprot:Phypoly_transcript_06931.p1 GENE.Phypoly_transcript_06931~~Phypoly_transcript_06931.p1  ORF type:complete len:475 (+),score=42.28 Phypoly_transcript_06931:38-1462(+)